MKFKQFLCKIFGHKITQVQLMIFEIKNNPVNVQRRGYFQITCPRCNEKFDPDPDKFRTQDETLHGKIT